MRDHPNGERRRHRGNRFGILRAVRSRYRPKHFWDASRERFVQTSSAIERQRLFLLCEQRYYLDERLHAGATAGCGPKKPFLIGWTPLELRCKEVLEFTPDWEEQLRSQVKKSARVSCYNRH